MKDNDEFLREVNYSLRPITDKAKDSIQSLVEKALNTYNQSRKRAMSKSVRLNRELHMTMILSNLILESFSFGKKTKIRITQSKGLKRNRYTPDSITANGLRGAVDILSSPEVSLIVVEKGAHSSYSGKSIQTTIKPQEVLLCLSKKMIKTDFETVSGNEGIILKTTQGRRRKVLTDYEETEYTRQARQELESINRYLAQADIECNGIQLSHSERILKRVFTNDFESCGRLFGGKWQSDSKLIRKGYRINGQSCVEIDFVSCGLYLAYASKGLAMDDHINGDAYDLGPEGSHYKRAGVKLVMLAMLGGDKPRRSFPAGAREALGIGNARSIKFKDIETLIMKKHEKIRDVFYDGKGLQRMHTESEILIKTLLGLQSEEVVALPIHDCVLVAESDRDTGEKIMLNTFKTVTGLFARMKSSPL